MATALNKDAQALRAAAPAFAPFDFRSEIPTPFPIDEPDATTPSSQYVVVRQIDMAPEGSAYPFVFDRPDRRHPISEFQNVIGKLVNGTYTRNGRVNQYYRPLDVRLSVPTRFVFVLSDRWEWRFSSKVKAASLGEDDMPTRARYRRLRHFVQNDDGQQDPFPHEQNCRILCFDAVPTNHPNPQQSNFNHRFNLVIECVYPDGDGQYRENTIPIVIDPDIRFPGGSGSE